MYKERQICKCQRLTPAQTPEEQCCSCVVMRVPDRVKWQGTTSSDSPAEASESAKSTKFGLWRDEAGWGGHGRVWEKKTAVSPRGELNDVNDALV